MTYFTDVYSATYLDTYGVAFPQAPLGIGCDLFLNNAWVDTSAYAYQRTGTNPPIGLTRGKPNESSGVTPADARWEWKNTDGRFSPKNPVGPYYKQLIRNTPVRFSVGALANHLRLESSSASSSSIASNSRISITGSVEIRMALRLTDWSSCILAARYDNTQPSWYFLISNTGILNFSWFDSGGTIHGNNATIPLPYTSGDMALRVTMDATTGNIAFYTSTTIDGTYTQLGATVNGLATPGATTIRAGNAPLLVGNSSNTTFGIPNEQMYGRVYEFRMYNGIGGTVVADGIFAAQNPGGTTWVDTPGNTWVVNGGAEISGRDYRWHGQMSSQPPTWDKTANDMYVAAEAGGPLRLIGQASNGPLASPMYRSATTQTGTLLPVAYWPMEDGKTATAFGPAIGPNPLSWFGPPNPNLASNSDFIGSAPLSTLNNTSTQGAIQPYNGAPWNANGTTWSIQWLMEVKTLPASGSMTFFQINVSSGAASYIAVGIDSSGNMIMNVYDANVNIIASLGPISYGNIQQPTLWSVTAAPSGSNVNIALSSIPVGASVGLTASATTSSTGHAGYASYLYVTPFGGFSDMVFGHILVQVPVVSIFNLIGPLNAWNGEQAGVRFRRLCNENGWPARILGASATSALMGPQSMDTFQNLLEECETADRGEMFECRQVLGLGYRTLASITNQTPALSISYTTATISGAGESDASGLAPTYDDLLTNNDYTVIQGNNQRTGSSYRAQLNDGSELSVSVAGDYQESPTINVSLATQLPDLANWLVHMGTVNEARWANIPFNLGRAALASSIPNLMAMEIGDAISISSIPTTVSYDPVGQIAIGFTEDLGAYYWWIQTNNAPSSPYQTGVFDDATYGRADTDGSTLTSAITSSATSFQVTTTDTTKPVWTQNASDFPFDINIGGERMTVSNITSATSPQTFTISARSVNGVVKAHLAGDDVRLWSPPIYALI